MIPYIVTLPPRLTQQTSSYQYILGHPNAIWLLHLYHGLPIDSFTCFEV